MTLFGYDQGVFSGVVITQDFLEIHDLVGPTKTTALSTVTAIYDIGCFFGALVAFTIGGRLGRKKAILLGNTIMAVGAILQTSSSSLAQMFVGRIVLGIGNAPIWQTETSQTKWRGKLVILDIMMNIAGFCLVNWINYGLSFAGGSVAWPFPLAFHFFFLFVLWGTTPWLPESPRWLLAHGREEEEIEVLSCLEAKPTDDPVVVTLRNEIAFSIQYERQNAMRWRDLLKKDKKNDTKTLRRVLLGVGSQFMQQFGGINIMSYYMPTVLTKSVAVFLIERMGRRGLMLLSTFGQFVCFLVITVLLRYSETSDNGSVYGNASVAFSSSIMGLLGAAAATATDWYDHKLHCRGDHPDWDSEYWLEVLDSLDGVQCCFPTYPLLFYPETASRGLEDLDAYYRTNPSLIVTGDPDAICRNCPQRYIEREDEEFERTAIGKGVMPIETAEHVEWTDAERKR
ncbi:hypothetical protein N7453_003580 [Penicillium expansum]|nr:hypothetical protein N7453_003580 [Penicillium expansum]